MKHLITVLTLVVTFLIVQYLNRQQHDLETFVISLHKYHYVVAHTKETIEVPLFISNKHHPLLIKHDIDRIRLMNGGVNMDVVIQDIVWSHEETFQDITYGVYHYILTIPTIDYPFLMEDVSLHIEHIEGKQYALEIGYVEFFNRTNPYDASWSNMFANRFSETLSIESMHITSNIIDDLYVSPNIETTLTYLNQAYRLTLENKVVLFWDVPIFIEKNGSIEMIIGVKWITSKRILSQTEGYHVTYLWYGSQSRQTF